MENNKGITLVALVITIIILLILAGVTINMVLMKNGIIAKTTQAKEKHLQESIEEQYKLKILNETVENNGKAPDIWDGKTINVEWYDTNENNYIIDSASKLVGFRNLVNSGNTFEGKTIRLAVNIDLGVLWKENENETILTKGKEWIPIGDEKYFCGTFDGQGYKISGVYINSTINNRGLFGTVKNGTIKNLIISNSYIKGKNSVGGIVGNANGEYIENCINDNCKIIGTDNNTGGIAGFIINTDIYKCYNNGKVNGIYYVGGIVGHVNVGSKSNKIKSCYNKGKILTTKYYAGGICGNNETNIIEDGYNIGEVKGNNSAGICSIGGKINRCYNQGNVTGSSVGGIVHHSTDIVYESFNLGNITGTNYNGGISAENATISNCFNKGYVNGQGGGRNIRHMVTDNY